MTTDDTAPHLTWTDDDEPRSGRFGDVYFSRDDGLAETRAVFLEGCGLPDAWAGRRHFTVAELGFGTGLNIAALLDLWRRTRPDGARLHIFSIEGFPLTADEARRALGAWPELAEAAQALTEAWPERTPGFHRVDLPGFHAVLDVAVGDVAWALDQWSGPADAWFLDGFSPALNPGMWSEAVMDRIAARSAPGARVATFTVAGAVRRGLSERGFVVEKKPGHGRKRERLEARRDGAPAPDRTPRVAIVGAGVAGAAVARALVASGIMPVVIEGERPGAGGSGFPAGLATPRLDAGDAAIAGLYAQALERARHLYDATPGAVLGQGVLQLPQAARDPARFAKIAAQPLWREGAMTVIDAEAATERLGEPTTEGGLMMADARVIQPAAILSAWLKDATMIAATVARIERDDAGWTLSDAEGRILAQADAVVVTAGWGTAGLLADAGLSPVRGQADWVEGPAIPGVAWGGYVAPTGTGFLFGATHDRDDVSLEPRDADSARNLDTLRGRLPHRAAQAESGARHRRVAVRATTRDRLPLAGHRGDGLYLLSGLGSRGFCVAPLLGEHVAALVAGTPSPLPATLFGRIDPDRLGPA
ncbi:MAG: FAD-dependent 5-carboxymethylaminomethyl-2-thiouridine(34) oxidoreductase MnmC [Brevundimonas sp.]|uniref:FAD-dependent 5-carboxymethylaminomethyl-2-thiouridine(34) oxidoreductase MnmC n=1 Tax=Brevundimonas sp. TaxID=1871086 RepID=UPI002716B1F9|nr:FAD-dependent 5-carboxymethylaminomethyl-2-thiouridine(34) oxidoreductase MnmC [Brevundimonas sp.]MDO9607417.1 FAD-dependent 5-carboxymethylaminomethyl-2-thiouridine(34) oxidoreductase MnmC [Brevundimonas sp.]